MSYKDGSHYIHLGSPSPSQDAWCRGKRLLLTTVTYATYMSILSLLTKTYIYLHYFGGKRSKAMKNNLRF